MIELTSLYDQDTFERFCYNLYKREWLNKHIPHCVQQRTYAEFFQSMLWEDRDPLNPNACSYEEYIEEYGFDGMIYSCFNEFLDNEYQDASYMQGLLSYIGTDAVEIYNSFQMPLAA